MNVWVCAYVGVYVCIFINAARKDVKGVKVSRNGGRRNAKATSVYFVA